MNIAELAGKTRGTIVVDKPDADIRSDQYALFYT